MRYMEEAARRVAVREEVDVLVVGGGVAGCVAAISAARAGARTAVIEAFGALGGAATQGLVTPFMHTGIAGNPMCSAISDELNRRAITLGFGRADAKGNEGHFDPIALAYVLEEAVLAAGVQVRLYTQFCEPVLEEGRVAGVIAQDKAGRFAILAKCVIDCTGDADVAARAGVPCDAGDPETGKNQPISGRCGGSGIDIAAFIEYLRELSQPGFAYPYALNPDFFHAAVVWGRDYPLIETFRAGVRAGELTEEDGKYWQCFSVPGRPDSLAFNCPEFFEHVDGANPDDLTRAQLEAHRAIYRQMAFYRKHFPGFAGASVSSIAGQVGVRESRRIHGEYMLTNEDVLSHRKFSDAVARSNYPIDVHGHKLRNQEIVSEENTAPYYEIPYRCMVPVGVGGLLVAGRCISSEFVAQSSLRIQPTARALGEAAGIAAAMAVRDGSEVRAIRGEDVRAEMLRRGARF